MLPPLIHVRLWTLQVHILNQALFAGGPQLGLTKDRTWLPTTWKTAHASWTHNHTNKVRKLAAIDEWDGQCVRRTCAAIASVTDSLNALAKLCHEAATD